MSHKENFPNEYTRWWVEFYYQTFKVNEHVLIPRLETESLVREAAKYARAEHPEVLIDVGTGSGIIPLSVLSVVNISGAFAVDISLWALAVARENNHAQGRNIQFFESDLLSVFLKEKSLLPEKAKILLVTNLPYIKADDWENMSPDTRHEPKEALFWGDETGFELYEKLFEQIEKFVAVYDPTTLAIFAEMGEDQKEIATEILGKHGWEFSFFADLRGIERFMKIRIK